MPDGATNRKAQSFGHPEVRMKRHPRVTLVVLLVLILAALGAQALQAQRVSDSVRAAGAASRGLRLLVSLDERRMWVVRDSADTLLRARVAVGSNKTLRFGSRVWRFVTPRGIHAVMSKEVDPLWVRPDWAYIEVAREHHLRIDSVTVRRPRRLSDGTILLVRGNQVGLLADSVFTPVPAEDEIVFDGVLFIPPIGTEHRVVPGTLGKYRLNLGDGIGLHGTPDGASIGQAVTHGCMRLGEADLEWIYQNVPIGTKVYIY
jgi:hypothetical protein